MIRGITDHVVNWDEVAKPKSLGGMGIGNLVARKRALLGKWLRRFPLEISLASKPMGGMLEWGFVGGVLGVVWGCRWMVWGARERYHTGVHGHLHHKSYIHFFKTSEWKWLKGMKFDFQRTLGWAFIHFSTFSLYFQPFFIPQFLYWIVGDMGFNLSTWVSVEFEWSQFRGILLSDKHYFKIKNLEGEGSHCTVSFETY